MDGNVIREVTASESGGSTTWTWDRDHVFREGSVLASVLYGIGVRHMHNDHLGTPRLITDGNHAKVGIHVYYPFGGELSLNPSELPNERLQFTGHERDGDLDYMHARYYSAATGRFTTVDPQLDFERIKSRPQAWNRYAYVQNNPIVYADRDGKDAIAAFFLGEPYRNISTLDVIFSRETLTDINRGRQEFAEEHRAMTDGFSPMPTTKTEVALSALMMGSLKGPTNALIGATFGKLVN